MEVENPEYWIEKDCGVIDTPLHLRFEKADHIENTSTNTIFVDADKLQYPLVLKPWQEGDAFQPFGMNGKSKKLSKLFKDEKLSLIEKDNCWVLWSTNQIVWVVGVRQDERFRILDSTNNILKISLEL